MKNFPSFSNGEQNPENFDEQPISPQPWSEQSFESNYQPPYSPQPPYQQQPPASYQQNSGNETQNPAMHFFLFLVSFLSLCFMSTGAGAVLFQFINKNFSYTDPLRYDYFNYFSQYAIKYGIAALIIATPVYFGLMYLINKYLYEGKISENSKVRKWLTYIVLFLAAGTIIGDLVSLVYNMLGGDIVARFILKVLVVLFIAGSIFAYYLVDMKKKDMIGRVYVANKIIFSAAVFLILLILILGFTVIDSPFASRDKKIDDQTISELRSIADSLENYYRKNNTLPNTLDELQKSDTYYSRQILNKSITYQKTGVAEYKLCADFKRASSEYKQEHYMDEFNEEWKHSKGKDCFDRNVESAMPKRGVLQNSPTDNFAAMAEARHRASIKSAMSSTVPLGIICRDNNGTILSGKGGDSACSVNGNDNLTWPQVSGCGSSPESARWIVQNGDSNNWTITLSCQEFHLCNGPSNAICSEKGCDFGGTCQ